MALDAMLVDLPGKIENTKLPYSHCLLPLFEAVINSIHAIEDRQKEQQAGGRIDITIDRERAQSLPGFSGSADIIGFTVTDDGIGFTDRNYKSFLTSDSTYKKGSSAEFVGNLRGLRSLARARQTGAASRGPCKKGRWNSLVG